MNIRWFTFEQFHGKQNIGSTKLRVHNLLKHWPEAGLYKYGEFPDVLIFQKVYATPDYKFPVHFENLKILDICDPDWLEGAAVKETVDAMDAVTCNTDDMRDFIKQLTDKPVITIPDRHDLEFIPELRTHKDKKKVKVVWFGYAHNAITIKGTIKPLEREGLTLKIISDENPTVERWAENGLDVEFVKFDWETLFTELEDCDVAILPQGTRPKDRFKSNNRTTLFWLAGIPVAKTLEELVNFYSTEERNKEAKKMYEHAIKNYDVRRSVQDFKDLIEDLYAAKKS